MIEDFDHWRERYDTLTFAEQQEYHNQLDEWYPEQAHFNFEAAKYAIEKVKPWAIWEAGAWKADLCAQMQQGHWRYNWWGIELCPNAIAKAKTDKINYHKLDRFDWWGNGGLFWQCEMFIATHFIEHLSDKHLTELLQWADRIRAIYFESPISEHGQEWDGYEGTHKLTYGWAKVRELLANYDCEDINDTCKLFTLRE
jgi:hypothetical protein